MRHQQERVYRLLNLRDEVYTKYDDPHRLVTWLMGKRTSHLLIQVVGTQGRVREYIVPDEDASDLIKMMVSDMIELTK